MRVENNITSINRLRVGTHARDRMRVRLEYDRLFSSADVHPTNLAGNAIVCINKFRTTPPRSSQTMNTNWEQDVRQSLSDIVNSAERPIRGKAGGSANAVIFADLAELLACLARDWATGTLTQNWWWKILLREERSIWSLWKRHAEFIPAALQHLVRQKVAATVLKGLSGDETYDLGKRVIESFAVHSLSGLYNVRLDQDRSPGYPGLHVFARTIRKDVSGMAEQSRNLAAPWRISLPEINFDEIEPEQERFLGICLMLQRRPSQVRSRRFAQDMDVWQQEVIKASRVSQTVSPIFNEVTQFQDEAVGNKDSRGARDDRIAHDVPLLVVNPDQRREIQPAALVESDNPSVAVGIERQTKSQPTLRPVPKDSVKANRNLPPQSRITDSPTPIPVSGSREDTSETFDRASLSQVTDSLPRPVDQASLTEDVGLIANERAAEPEIAVTSPAEEDVEFDPAVVIDTDLGGLFYLINLGIYLDLYGDFTTPNSPGIHLNIWDFVRVLGLELIEPSFPDDPIWSLLDTLAGHEETIREDDDFGTEDEWRMTPAWLVPFASDQAWKWTVRSNRLQLVHPAEFLVLDVKRDSRIVSDQLCTETTAYREFISKLDFALEIGPALVPTTSYETSQLWFSRLLPYVRARLRLALGSASNPGRLLCQRSARVKVTDTHVDVYFSLSDLPIEIRLAGLDRDPGWVPAAGRFITFHYQ